VWQPDYSAARQAVNAMREGLLHTYPIGRANPHVTREIGLHLDTLRDNAPEYSGPIISSLSRWTAILFSARKHRQYGTVPSGGDGYQRVRDFMLSDLMVLDDHIRQASEPSGKKEPKKPE
jgi:hypothetical protein